MNQLISNFHTHTELCHHASGRPVDYVKYAAEQGCSELGFSDHCPYPVNIGFQWDNCRMSVSQIELYVNQVNEAKEAADFPVHLGFECEYDRNFLNWYKDELKCHYGAEYLVFGPHWVNDDGGRPYALDFNRDLKLLHKYTRQIIEGLESGLYSILAHPDLFMAGYKIWDDEAKSCLTDILNAAEALDIPLEINGLGISRGLIDTPLGERFGYPYLEFWELVSKSGAKVICDSDDHNPKDVLKNALNARQFAATVGITPIETIF